MAKRRDLKKDVNYMVKEVIDECYMHLYYSPEVNQENVMDIISEARQLKEKLLRKLNKSPDKGHVSKALYYKGIVDELCTKCISFIERLNSLVSNQ